MMRRLSTACALLATTLAACDEEVDVEDLPPAVQLEGYCREGGRTYLLVRVQDYERAPVDLDLIADLGGSSTRLPTGTTGDGLIGLRSERGAPGALHRVEWGAAFETSPDCGEGACAATPCTSDACVRECATLAAGQCIDTCRALELATEPLGDVETCTGRPGTPPPTLQLTALASDGENVTSSEATLTLAATCPNDP
jgi:hypothetical protein